MLWLLYTGMQWKCLPIPTDAQGTLALHYTSVYRALAKWVDDGSRERAFIASAAHLAAARFSRQYVEAGGLMAYASN
jgi:hypothetical protein